MALFQKRLPRRPTGSTTHKNLLAVYPQAVLDYAWQIRDLLDVGRDRILWAATLAVLLEPPERPVAYPDMGQGAGLLTIPYTVELHAAVRSVGKLRFFRRHAWMAYFGMTERYEQTVAILRLFTPELDELQVQLLLRSAEVAPCPITKPDRAPVSRRSETTEKPSPARKRRRKPAKPTSPKKGSKRRKKAKA